MTIRGMPVSELLVIVLPLIVVFGLTRRDSSDAFLWLLAPVGLAAGLAGAWLYSQFGPAGPDHDPVRTYFCAAVVGLAGPILGRMYRKNLNELRKTEDET